MSFVGFYQHKDGEYFSSVYPSAVVDILDRFYRYKSVTIQMFLDAELAPIPYISRELFPRRGIRALYLVERVQRSKS